MVKKRVRTNSEVSDFSETEAWLKEAPTRWSTKRGKYKNSKTKEQRKASKAAAQKKWRMAKKTDRAKELAEAKKEEFSAMNTTKTKATKR